jgi:hypothetical protein
MIMVRCIFMRITAMIRPHLRLVTFKYWKASYRVEQRGLSANGLNCICMSWKPIGSWPVGSSPLTLSSHYDEFPHPASCRSSDIG